MAIHQTIRKNIVTGEWEHYVDVPFFDDNHWVPGIFNYHGKFPITETTQSLMRNGEDFILSYEDVVYEDYETVTKRNLPEYQDVTNLYDIQFEELYKPESPISISFTKTNPTYETVDISATITGGYPYRSPNVHYKFNWTILEYESDYLSIFNAQKGNLKIDGIGKGLYQLTATDANGISVTETVEVETRDLLQKNRLPSSEDLDLSVNLYFWSNDPVGKKGTLRAVINAGESISPYNVKWIKGTEGGNVIGEEIVEISPMEDLLVESELWIGIGPYSIVVTSADGQVTTDFEEVTDADFPVPYVSEESYGQDATPGDDPNLPTRKPLVRPSTDDNYNPDY